MGLGKTVELLACITSHPYTGPPPQFADPAAARKCAAGGRGWGQGDAEAPSPCLPAGRLQQHGVPLVAISLPLCPSTVPCSHRRKKRGVVVECVCGATEEAGYEGERCRRCFGMAALLPPTTCGRLTRTPNSTPDFAPAGLWIQCDECDVWQHAACLGLRREPADFVCGACQRARAAAEVTQDCGATLIVCPTPIVHQWSAGWARAGAGGLGERSFGSAAVHGSHASPATCGRVALNPTHCH